jgi:DNA-binding CsgD family transcriptional regulator/tetratricopeptide (TPR) repeat protein
MLDLAEQAAPALLGAQQALWLGRLERDRDNLAEALRWTLQHSEIDLSLRFARSLWRFWWLHGHLSEGMAWLEQVLAVAAGLDSDDRLPLQAAVLNGAGVLAHVLGAYERATLLLGESLDLWRRLGSEVGEAAALHNLAALAREQGDWQRAAQAYTESLELERRVGNRWGIATSLTNLGALAHDQGDDEQAARLHTEALELMRELGDSRGIASALHNLADVARDKGDWQRAALLHEESLGLWRQLGDRWSIGVSSLALGRVRQHLGDARTAARLLDESLAVFDALGVRQGSAACLEGLAEATLASGRAVDAARLLGAAEALRETIGAPLAPRDRPGHARLVDALRRSVAPAAWRAAWRAGRSLTLGDVTLDAHRLASTMDAAPPPAGPSDVLTPRQRDVAALIVRGLTNRQIAAQLVISERTADRHVSNILDKLGLSTRAQVAAWVARDRPNHP